MRHAEKRDGGGAPAATRGEVRAWVARNVRYSAAAVGLPMALVACPLGFVVRPVERPVFLGDVSALLPHKGTSVHFGLLVLLAVLAALGIGRSEARRGAPGPRAALRGAQLAVDAAAASFLTLGVTIFLKLATGKARPDLLDVCPTGVDCPLDELQAFPSGHSSFAFCTATYLSGYLFWRFHLAAGPAATPPGTPPSLAQHQKQGRLSAGRLVPSPTPSTFRVDSPASDTPLTFAPRSSREAADNHGGGEQPPGRGGVTCGEIARDEARAAGRFLAVLLPQFAAMAVAVSRYLHNRHSLLDITAGALVGAAVAAVVLARSVSILRLAPRTRPPGEAGPPFAAAAAWAAASEASVSVDVRSPPASPGPPSSRAKLRYPTPARPAASIELSGGL